MKHSVRDEGVAGSNPATPTSFSRTGCHYGARYGERNLLLGGAWRALPSEGKGQRFESSRARHQINNFA